MSREWDGATVGDTSEKITARDLRTKKGRASCGGKKNQQCRQRLQMASRRLSKNEDGGRGWPLPGTGRGDEQEATRFTGLHNKPRTCYAIITAHGETRGSPVFEGRFQAQNDVGHGDRGWESEHVGLAPCGDVGGTGGLSRRPRPTASVPKDLAV